MSWLGPSGMASKDIYPYAILGLARDMEQSTAQLIGDVLRHHPDIADKYVEVRANVLRSGLAE